MKTYKFWLILIITVIMIGLVGIGYAQGPLTREEQKANIGTAFTYQGRLFRNNVTTDGFYEFQFTLYDEATAGAQVGTPLQEALLVVDGLFVAELDFGADIFTGEARYLQVSVRPEGDTGAYKPLNPRQALNPAPYALHAGGVAWENISDIPADIADGDDGTAYTPGFGLVLTGNEVQVLTSTIQQRVTQSCDPKNAIRVINADGTVICEAISGSSGDITAVNSGPGLLGGATSGSVTLTVAFAGSGSAETVARSDHKHDISDIIGGLPTATVALSATEVSWDGIVGMPSGFADGIDNDTTYIAGEGLTLNGTTFVLDAEISSVTNSLMAADGDPANAVYVDADGLTGVGTTTPAANLHIQGNLSVAVAGTVSIGAGNATVTGSSTAFSADLAPGDALLIAGELFTILTISDNTTLTVDHNHPTGATDVTAYTDSDLLLVENGANESQVVINKSGQMGIGSANPQARLDVDGNIRLEGTISYADLPDYRLVYRDDFESAVVGWSETTTTTIGGSTILGGYNVTGGDSNFSKDFDLSSIPHSEVMVRVTYYSIDSWDDETAFVSISDGTAIVPGVWTEMLSLNDPGRLNIGGNGGSPWADGAYNVELTTSHSSNNLTVTVGAVLDEDIGNESYGVDNVEVWVR